MAAPRLARSAATAQEVRVVTAALLGRLTDALEELKRAPRRKPWNAFQDALGLRAERCVGQEWRKETERPRRLSMKARLDHRAANDAGPHAHNAAVAAP